MVLLHDKYSTSKIVVGRDYDGQRLRWAEITVDRIGQGIRPLLNS